MNNTLIYKPVVFFVLLFSASIACAQNDKIYHKGWIDFNKNGKMDVFEDPSKPIENRVKDLLSQMNLDEKTCQTATLYGYGRVLKDEMPTAEWKTKIWKDGIANIDEELNSLPYNKKAVTAYSFPFSKHANAINTVQKWFVEETRLGIPVDFSNEGIHGLCHDRATPFPAPINIGSTWNKELVFRAGSTVGREARALGYTNVYAPILDVARDQRWGRVVECYAEDPFLIAELGKQMTLGIQDQGVAATLKHYAVYSVPKGGRDGNARTDPHVAPRELHEMFLYPFKRVIQEAKPMGVMSSYNDWEIFHKIVWPEVLKSIKDSGIQNMEIYNMGTRLFMTMDTNDDFSFEEKTKMDSTNIKVQEWENLMWKYQQKIPGSKSNEKWVLMKKIFEL